MGLPVTDIINYSKYELVSVVSPSQPQLIALFNRPVDKMWLELLAELKIWVINWSGSSWICDALAPIELKAESLLTACCWEAIDVLCVYVH